MRGCRRRGRSPPPAKSRGETPSPGVLSAPWPGRRRRSPPAARPCRRTVCRPAGCPRHRASGWCGMARRPWCRRDADAPCGPWRTPASAHPRRARRHGHTSVVSPETARSPNPWWVSKFALLRRPSSKEKLSLWRYSRKSSPSSAPWRASVTIPSVRGRSSPARLKKISSVTVSRLIGLILRSSRATACARAMPRPRIGDCVAPPSMRGFKNGGVHGRTLASRVQ